MQTHIKILLNQINIQFSQNYQDRLSQIILFGSQAINEAEPDSDIDILVVLKGEINPVQEIKKNNPWIAEMCLETDELINCIYLSEEQYHHQNTPLIRNIKTEGIPM